MHKNRANYDVFISNSHRDVKLSAEVARVLESHELVVFTDSELTVGPQTEEALWEALAESQAVVAIIPENEPGSWISFELGAAKAWNKPIYAIASNPNAARLPAGLRGVVIYSPSRIEEIAQEINRSSDLLSDTETSVLVKEYQRIGLPVDELMLQPEQLSFLSNQFRKRTKRRVPSEELVRMLLRLRKTGDLPRLEAKKRQKAT